MGEVPSRRASLLLQGYQLLGVLDGALGDAVCYNVIHHAHQHAPVPGVEGDEAGLGGLSFGTDGLSTIKNTN